jgi:hypothetical protein
VRRSAIAPAAREIGIGLGGMRYRQWQRQEPSAAGPVTHGKKSHLLPWSVRTVFAVAVFAVGWFAVAVEQALQNLPDVRFYLFWVAR